MTGDIHFLNRILRQNNHVRFAYRDYARPPSVSRPRKRRIYGGVGRRTFVLSPPRRGTTTDKDRMTHGIIDRTRRDTYRLLITTPSYRRVGLRDAASRRCAALRD